ncbi:hypothetical protein HUS23_03550 [Ectothiorhodospiraceae bacterium 2226]|nr:hypothetical protein HUS23_03550 [Ectothiorhodospiraceae bacterium 2226]
MSSLALLAGAQGAAAFGGGPYPITDMSLEGTRVNSTWRFDGEDERVRAERLGISWREGLDARLSGGVELGFLYLRPRTRNPAMDARGWYLGFDLRYHAWSRGPFALDLGAGYRYMDADDERDEQRLRLHAHRAEVGVAGTWRVAERLRLSAGTSRVYLEGEERLRGPVDRTVDLRQRERFLHRLGAEVVTAGPGGIGLEYRQGAEDGWQLYARREF